MTWLRQVARLAGAPFRVLSIGAIRLYRISLSRWLGVRCRFYPSCSRYAEDAIRARGVVIGIALGMWRVLRCNPFGRGGLDPAPVPGAMDDEIIRVRSRRGAAHP